MGSYEDMAMLGRIPDREAGSMSLKAPHNEKIRPEIVPGGGVFEELGELERAIAAHGESLNILTGRLRPALLESMPDRASGRTTEARTPDRNVCAVAESIRTLRRQVEMQSTQLADLYQRVDL